MPSTSTESRLRASVARFRDEADKVIVRHLKRLKAGFLVELAKNKRLPLLTAHVLNPSKYTLGTVESAC